MNVVRWPTNEKRHWESAISGRQLVPGNALLRILNTSRDNYS